jgi:EAL domain-containing protein (putative c-di-GMP-specific phosphodiesterase class I)
MEPLTQLNIQPLQTTTTCGACKDGVEAPFAFTMAFQPIVSVASRTVFAYEALVRGPGNESAYSILSKVTEQNRYAFDQSCRVTAIALASRLGMPQTGARLSVNFMPGAVYSPAACIQQTLRAAREHSFPLDKLIFEITEDERVADTRHLSSIVAEYRKHGFIMALDDFGAAHSNLTLMAELGTEIIKLDGALIRDIDRRPVAHAIVRSFAALCRELGVLLVAESIETMEEYHILRECNIDLMQGYLFAKPAFEALPAIFWPEEQFASLEEEPAA